MLIQFDCCECIIKQALRLARDVDSSPDRRWQYFRETLELFQQHHRTATPPEMAAYYFDLFARQSGISDGFTEIKERSTRLALELYDEMETLCAAAGANEFITRLKLAVSGNMIDYGVNPDFDLSQAEEMIREVLTLPCDDNAVSDLKQRIQQAGKIVYILDNCGEAVFDRIFMEPYKDKITLGVRGCPALNDVTAEDLPDCDLAGWNYIKNGPSGVPGTILTECSDEFKTAFEHADLIIAKGQGNFETMNEYPHPMAFLFLAKCPVVIRAIGAELNSIQIRLHNLK